MDNKQEFKLFVQEHPKLINKVKNHEVTWQELYELYDLYGTDEKIWEKYFYQEKESNNNNTNLKDIIKLAKNVDLDKVESSLNSLQKAVSLFTELFVTEKNNSATYQPRPIYRKFDD